MKRTLLWLVAALAVLTGAGTAWAVSGSSSYKPHTNYTPAYNTCGGAACHTVSKGTFLPESLNTSKTPDYTNFCLGCHNAAGEGHDKSAGSPSTNTYSGLTSIDKTASWKGSSHSWRGVNGEAGTSVPAWGTAYLQEGGKVVCATCHSPLKGTESYINWRATTTSDNINYAISGESSTAPYLSQYLKVYRTSSAEPAISRDRKNYLVSPSEYTYNNANATITFLSAQTQPIIADLQPPYLRVSNAVNSACLGCHPNRSERSVSHAPGMGVKDGHPVTVPFGNRSGIGGTIKPSSTAYMENGQVLCTSCHDPHNSGANNGQLLRAEGEYLCRNCHKTRLDGYTSAGSVNVHTGPKHEAGGGATNCRDCHSLHGPHNVLLVREKIGSEGIAFLNFSGSSSFGGDTGTGICETCHTATIAHKTDASTGAHYTGENCLRCHKHEKGFMKPSVIGTGCGGCHPYPGTTTHVWAAGNGHNVQYDGVIATHLAATGYDADTDQYATVCSDPDKCGKCHSGGGHMNEVADVNPNGFGACGSTDFAFNSGAKTCSSVSCHGPGKTTPNWN